MAGCWMVRTEAYPQEKGRSWTATRHRHPSKKPRLHLRDRRSPIIFGIHITRDSSQLAGDTLRGMNFTHAILILFFTVRWPRYVLCLWHVVVDPASFLGYSFPNFRILFRMINICFILCLVKDQFLMVTRYHFLIILILMRPSFK